MRPTIEEQLVGTCRVLEEVVAPEVTDPHAVEVLRGLVSNLMMLSAAIPGVPEFLVWDNTGTARLLQALKPAVSQPMAAAIDTETVLGDPGPLDWAALSARNEQLRELLVQVVETGALDDSAEQLVRVHLAARAARSPIRFATPLPTAAKPGGS